MTTRRCFRRSGALGALVCLIVAARAASYVDLPIAGSAAGIPAVLR